jgi:tetratricopeptide (TPR) repeat protein
VAGEAEAALSALRAHLSAWPCDAVALATTAFTNGLIGSSGRAGQKRMLLDLLENLAPIYGDDWWFTAHHGMALSENGQREAARPKIERSLAQNPKNPWAAHALAHLCYEEGDPNAARAFLVSWLTTYPRNGPLYSHLNWHLALGHLEAGDAEAAYRLFREAFSPDVHSGPPRGKVTDPVSFLWRWELAGHPRDANAWRITHDFTTGAFPRAGVAFSDMHIALAEAVAGNEAALDAHTQQMDELVRNGRYPSGPCVPAMSRAFAAFERRNFPAAIEALEPIAGELERIGGSRAQLDLVEFTLLQAYIGADRLDEARRMLSVRRRGSSSLPVAGLAAVPDGKDPYAVLSIGGFLGVGRLAPCRRGSRSTRGSQAAHHQDRHHGRDHATAGDAAKSGLIGNVGRHCPKVRMPPNSGAFCLLVLKSAPQVAGRPARNLRSAIARATRPPLMRLSAPPFGVSQRVSGQLSYIVPEWATLTERCSAPLPSTISRARRPIPIA